ncbi:MAG: hypothetical protein KBT12_03475 [Bacteroidales bacterium]|nr:hypothetical protein [Candidatus Physcousia equi]
MKKNYLLLFLLSLIGWSSGAWAIDEGVYQYKNTGNQRGSMAYYSDKTQYPVLADVTLQGYTGAEYTVSSANNPDVNLNWYVVPSVISDGYFYIFSVANGKFIAPKTKGQSSNIEFSESPCQWRIVKRTINSVEYDVMTTPDWGANNVLGLSFACGTKFTAETQLKPQTQGITTSTDGGIKNKLEKQDIDISSYSQIIESAKARIEEMEAKTPTAGKFYRFKSLNGGGYITSTLTSNKVILATTPTLYNSLFYYDAENHLTCVDNAQKIASTTANGGNMSTTADYPNNVASIQFHTKGGQEGCAISFGYSGSQYRYVYGRPNCTTDAGNATSASNLSDVGYFWDVEPVKMDEYTLVLPQDYQDATIEVSAGNGLVLGNKYYIELDVTPNPDVFSSTDLDISDVAVNTTDKTITFSFSQKTYSFIKLQCENGLGYMKDTDQGTNKWMRVDTEDTNNIFAWDGTNLYSYRTGQKVGYIGNGYLSCNHGTSFLPLELMDISEETATDANHNSDFHYLLKYVDGNTTYWAGHTASLFGRGAGLYDNVKSTLLRTNSYHFKKVDLTDYHPYSVKINKPANAVNTPFIMTEHQVLYDGSVYAAIGSEDGNVQPSTFKPSKIDGYADATVTVDNTNKTITVSYTASEERNNKYVVLVVAGQSNAVGYDESVVTWEDLNTEPGNIVQLGYVGDNNKKIMPLGHCAQSYQYTTMSGLGNLESIADPTGTGTKGIQLPLAELIYKNKTMVPEGYKLLVISASYGGHCFGDGNWGVNSSNYTQMRDRVKYVLDLNEQNKYLGCVWIQGEFDAQNDAYMNANLTGFPQMVEAYNNYFASYASRTVIEGGFTKDIWWNMRSTAWWSGEIGGNSGYQAADRSERFNTILQKYQEWNPSTYITFPSDEYDTNQHWDGSLGSRPSSNWPTHFGNHAYRVKIAPIVYAAIAQNGYRIVIDYPGSEETAPKARYHSTEYDNNSIIAESDDLESIYGTSVTGYISTTAVDDEAKTVTITYKQPAAGDYLLIKKYNTNKYLGVSTSGAIALYDEPSGMTYWKYTANDGIINVASGTYLDHNQSTFLSATSVQVNIAADHPEDGTHAVGTKVNDKWRWIYYNNNNFSGGTSDGINDAVRGDRGYSWHVELTTEEKAREAIAALENSYKIVIDYPGSAETAPKARYHNVEYNNNDIIIGFDDLESIYGTSVTGYISTTAIDDEAKTVTITYKQPAEGDYLLIKKYNTNKYLGVSASGAIALYDEPSEMTYWKYTADGGIMNVASGTYLDHNNNSTYLSATSVQVNIAADHPEDGTHAVGTKTTDNKWRWINYKNNAFSGGSSDRINDVVKNDRGYSWYVELTSEEEAREAIEARATKLISNVEQTMDKVNGKDTGNPFTPKSVNFKTAIDELRANPSDFTKLQALKDAIANPDNYYPLPTGRYFVHNYYDFDKNDNEKNLNENQSTLTSLTSLVGTAGKVAGYWSVWDITYNESDKTYTMVNEGNKYVMRPGSLGGHNNGNYDKKHDYTDDGVLYYKPNDNSTTKYQVGTVPDGGKSALKFTPAVSLADQSFNGVSIADRKGYVTISGSWDVDGKTDCVMFLDGVNAAKTAAHASGNTGDHRNGDNGGDYVVKSGRVSLTKEECLWSFYRIDSNEGNAQEYRLFDDATLGSLVGAVGGVLTLTNVEHIECLQNIKDNILETLKGIDTNTISNAAGERAKKYKEIIGEIEALKENDDHKQYYQALDPNSENPFYVENISSIRPSLYSRLTTDNNNRWHTVDRANVGDATKAGRFKSEIVSGTGAQTIYRLHNTEDNPAYIKTAVKSQFTQQTNDAQQACQFRMEEVIPGIYQLKQVMSDNTNLWLLISGKGENFQLKGFDNIEISSLFRFVTVNTVKVNAITPRENTDFTSPYEEENPSDEEQEKVLPVFTTFSHSLSSRVNKDKYIIPYYITEIGLKKYWSVDSDNKRYPYNEEDENKGKPDDESAVLINRMYITMTKAPKVGDYYYMEANQGYLLVGSKKQRVYGEGENQEVREGVTEKDIEFNAFVADNVEGTHVQAVNGETYGNTINGINHFEPNVVSEIRITKENMDNYFALQYTYDVIGSWNSKPLKGEGLGFYHLAPGYMIGKNKAYIAAKKFKDLSVAWTDYNPNGSGTREDWQYGDDASGVKAFLESGDGFGICVADKKGNVTRVIEVEAKKRAEQHTIYDLQGRRVASPAKGVYIVDGKKIMFK